MLQRITGILEGNTIQAVHFHFEDGKVRYQYFKVRKKKKELLIEAQFESADYEQLLSKIVKNSPVVLLLSGNGIITKTVENKKNYQADLIFKSDPDDFYWYEIVQKEQRFVSIARKDFVNKHLTSLAQNQITIVDVAIGPLVLSAIKTFIDNTSISVDDYQLSYEQGKLTAVTRLGSSEMQEYQIGNDTFNSTTILPFAGIIQYLYPNDDIVAPDLDLKIQKEELLYRRLFQYLGVGVLGFFLISLLSSYVLLIHYQQEHQELMVALGAQNVAYEKLVVLENDKENKTAILKESGLENSNYLSYYLSTISEHIPSGLVISELEIFPLHSKIKPLEKINFDHNTITIEGSVNSYNSFSLWIKRIKEKEWVEDIEIAAFQQNNKTNFFKVLITVRFNV
ncbi:hypothetical protein NBT05_17290 [Aquimarina sp. ERC-38]|uniref:hypothetical protein n=1 Tax=Aquimarina sp. ERC-38 TaxID=2949996 RepID=UPI0022465A95|nr:hypothetical protein [Aquimarina sp. ERC-38]UZO80683.1 hypothetical protein NBT05_17290 [Aquimarina sp. ERC-38]